MRSVRPASLAKHAGTPWERRFAYSGEGDLVEVRDSERGATRHEHDAAHRLVKSEHPDGRVDTYAYNRAGALYQSPTLGQATVGECNRLRYAHGERLEYNHRDHVSERVGPRGTIAFDYDSRDQLTGVFWNGPQGERWGWDAEYDALGRRIRKSPGYTNDTLYYWDTDRLAAEVFHDGRLRVYVYPDAFAMVPMLFLDYESVDADPESGTRYYVHTDQRGCPERILDDQGVIVWKAQNDAYGWARIEVGHDFHQPLRFPGHWYDAELGLHYNRFRYYSPEYGSYLQTDPWGIASQINTYAYLSRPLTQVDLLGLGCEVLQFHTLRNPDGSETIFEIVRTAGGAVATRVSATPTRLGRRPWMEGAYHGPKPRYENPGHHDPSSGRFRGGGAKTSRVPPDAEAVYRTAIPDSEGRVWYGRNAEGDVYVYRPTNDGSVHWAGASNTPRGIHVPRDVEKRFERHKADRARHGQ